MGGDYIVYFGFDVVEAAIFASYKVAVAHKGDAVAADADNAVNHISAIVNVGKVYSAFAYLGNGRKHSTFAASYNEGKHRVAFYGEYHFSAFVYQAYGFGNYKIVAYWHDIVF